MASILWPALTIISAKDSKTNGLVFTFYVYVISTFVVYLFFVDNSVFEKVTTFDLTFWVNMFMITILSTTFATSIYFIGIAKLGTKEVSTFIFLVPTSALISSAIYLNEQITYNTIFGTICTVISIYILNNLNLFKMFKKS
jgi:drug/metabolite transporter (DMT)-like permease